MERMLGTIFADLHILKVDMNSIDKMLKSQRVVNKLVALNICVLTLVGYCSAKHCMDNKEKIERLTKEVEELKKSKGE